MNLEALGAMIDLPLLWEYRRILLSGLTFNVYVFLLAAVLANVLGLVMAVLRVQSGRLPRAIGTAYVEVFRNAPEYVLLTWVHFVLPVLIARLLQTQVSFTPFFSAVLALGVAYGGYFTETFRGGIQAIPRAHVESAQTLGMSRALTLRRIVLPQAARHMLPEGLNLLVSLFKATTLVSLISVPDLLYQVTIVTQEVMRPMPLYTGAALIYFVLISVIAGAVNRFTRRWRTQAQ